MWWWRPANQRWRAWSRPSKPTPFVLSNRSKTTAAVAPNEEPALASRSVFARRYDARLRHRIFAAGVGKQRGRRVHREPVRARRHFVLALEHLVKGDFPPGVRCHAAH